MITIIVLATVMISGLVNLECRRDVHTAKSEATPDLLLEQDDQDGWQYNGEPVKELLYDEEMFAGPGIVEPQFEVDLGEAQILVYRNGEKVLLDPESSCHKLLKLACEEMLVSTEFLIDAKIESLPDLEKVKRKECAIEVNYAQPIRLALGREQRVAAAVARSHARVSQFLIPLTGELAKLQAKGERSLEGEYVYVFLSPEVVSDGSRRAIGTTKDVGEIRDILALFNMSVPVK